MHPKKVTFIKEIFDGNALELAHVDATTLNIKMKKTRSWDVLLETFL
jgi:hypothetical protein